MKSLMTFFAPKLAILSASFFAYPLLLSANPSSTSTDPVNNDYLQHWLPQAIQVQITDSGIKAFQQNLLTIINDQGIDINRGFFSNIHFETKNEITYEEMEKTSPQTAKTFKAIQKALNDWLEDFYLKNPRPGLDIKSLGYGIEIKKLNFYLDQALLQSLNKKDGAVLVLELQVSEFVAKANSILIYDLNNPALKKVGFNELSLTMPPPSPPLRLRVPLYFRMNEKSYLEFETLKIASNVNDIQLQANYQGLTHPKITISVDEQKWVVSSDQINAELKKQIPQRLERLKESLHEYIQEKLPAYLNEMAKKSLLVPLEQVNYMDPPGAPINDTREQFRWGLKSEKIWMNHSLHWEFGVFVEDNLNKNSAPKPEDRSKKPAKLNDFLAATQYDMGVAIDRGFINRMLQLSFERKLFNNLKSCTDTKATILTKAPLLTGLKPSQFLAPANSYTTYATIQVQTLQKPEGFQTAILTDPFEISLDLILRIQYNPETNEIEIHSDHFDANSFAIEDRFLRLATDFVRDKVLSSGREELIRRSQIWKSQQKCPTENIPTSLISTFVLPTPMGMKATAQAIHVDQYGNILVYLKLGESNP